MANTILTYPSNLGDVVPSFLQLSIGTTPKEYHKQVFQNPVDLGKKIDISKIINLPIPAGLQDNTDAVWSNEATGNLLQSAANKLMDSKILGSMSKVSTGLHGERHIMHEFSNINARAYNLSWQFTPQNAGESSTIEEVFQTMRRAQLPEVVDGLHQVVRSFRLPDMILLKIIGPSGNFIKFLPCFIVTVAMDRNYDDTYIEYVDGTVPFSMLNLSLVEITSYTKQIFDEVYK